MTPTSLRRCGPGHAQRLAELGTSTFRQSYGGRIPRGDLERHVRSAFAPAAVERQLRAEGSAFFLAEREGRPVGYLKVNLAGAQTDLDEAGTVEIESLYVVAAHQGTGVGGRLLAHAVALAGDAGARALWLGVWERNERAIAFYEHHCFRAFGEHGFELGTIRHRDVLMRLDLRDRTRGAPK